MRTQETSGSSKGMVLKSTTIPRIIPYTPAAQYQQGMSEGCPATFQACQNPSSVVGADVCPTVLLAPLTPIPSKHGKPPTCLWTSTVLWASSFAIHGECGKTSHMRLTQTVLWVPTIILYPMTWAKRLSSIRTLSLSLSRL